MLDKDAGTRERSSFSRVVKGSCNNRVVVGATRESEEKRAAKKKQPSLFSRVSPTRVFLLSRAFLTCFLIVERLQAIAFQSLAYIAQLKRDS